MKSSLLSTVFVAHVSVGAMSAMLIIVINVEFAFVTFMRNELEHEKYLALRDIYISYY